MRLYSLHFTQRVQLLDHAAWLTGVAGPTQPDQPRGTVICGPPDVMAPRISFLTLMQAKGRSGGQHLSIELPQ